MKKIIKGKTYNTETAQERGYWDNGFSSRDYKWYCETLYQKKTGEFFLHGEGGPASRYAEPIGNMRTSGERIIPMTYEEASEWAERKLDGDSYEEIFGTIEEGTENDPATLKEIRTLLGISRAELSRRYGIPVRTLEDWEAGKRIPPEWLMKLLERVIKEDATTE